MSSQVVIQNSVLSACGIMRGTLALQPALGPNFGSDAYPLTGLGPLTEPLCAPSSSFVNQT